MKNVTVTLEDELADWARVEAARAGLSLSRWLAGLIQSRRQGGMTQEDALKVFLASGTHDLGFYGKAPSHEEMNERESLRRHQRADLREGSHGSYEAERGDPLAGGAGGAKRGGRKSSKPA
jgi:hypothetical protein